MKTTFLSLTMVGLILCSCEGPKESKRHAVIETDSCSYVMGNVHFTQSLNLKEKNTVQLMEDTLTMAAGRETDLFCDPKGKATNTSAPVLLAEVDNTKPFTFTVKVEPMFTADGTYSAGGIMAFVDKTHWQKLCFEQDEAGNHRIVTVRTIDVSDDNNHDMVNGSTVYLRFSSDTEVIGNYYSEDGKKWHLVRIYKNEYPAKFFLSISSQSPKGSIHICKFTEMDFVEKTVNNLREGNL